MTQYYTHCEERRTKPWRMESVSCRLSDEYTDILEAEYLHDDRLSKRYHRDDQHGHTEARHCYDESQALEVLSAEPGWVHGEQFYVLKAPGFEDEECFIQDFGFEPYQKRFSDFMFWQSIVEEEEAKPKNLSDLLSPDFFLPGHKKISG